MVKTLIFYLIVANKRKSKTVEDYSGKKSTNNWNWKYKRFQKIILHLIVENSLTLNCHVIPFDPQVV